MFQALRPRTYRSKLFLALGVVLLIMVALQTALVSIVVRQQIEDVEGNEKIALARVYADQSVFALLIAADDPDVAQRLTDSYVEAPNIDYAGLYDQDGTLIASSGDPSISGEFEARIISEGLSETATHWRVLAPVMTTEENESEPAEVSIGLLVLVASKEQVNALIRELVIFTASGLFLIALFIAAFVTYRIRRITEPLKSAAEVLSEGRLIRLRPEADSPEEFQTVAIAFNTLMDQLAAERKGLEDQVDSRTEALREALRTAQDAEKTRTDFSAAVTHEMKAPLQLMQLHLDRAIHELEFLPEGGETVRTHLENVIKQGDSLLERINQVLIVSRKERDPGILNEDVLSIAELVDTLEQRLAALAKQNGNRLSFDVDEEQTIVADREKLVTVLSNVISNACKFTKNGQIDCEIAVTEEVLEAVVTDTGIGMPKSIQSEVFEPYRQGDMGISREYGGTGLGLAIARNYTESLGGSIDLTSTKGIGTCVRIVVPIKTAYDAEGRAVDSIG